MTSYFFPSCKVSAQFAEASRQLAAYLGQYQDMTITGCCRPQNSLPAGGTGVVICHNCANILEEKIIEEKSASQIEYVWQLIDRDPDFPYPDYQGEQITVQDCLLAAERPQVRQAVRSLLGKMNFQVVEAPAEPFRCSLLLAPCSEANLRLAPRHYGGENAQMFLALSKEEQDAYFRRHCAQIATQRVVCYCRSCADSINRGGKQAVHLLELLFPQNR